MSSSSNSNINAATWRDVQKAYARFGLHFDPAAVGANLYDIAKVKAKYRDLSLVKHPDKGGTNESFQELNNDYELIQRYLAKPSSYPRGSEAQRCVGNRVQVFGCGGASARFNGNFGIAYKASGSERVDLLLEKHASKIDGLLYSFPPHQLRFVCQLDPIHYVGKRVMLRGLTGSWASWNDVVGTAWGTTKDGKVTVALDSASGPQHRNFPPAGLSIVSLPAAIHLVGYRVEVFGLFGAKRYLNGAFGKVSGVCQRKADDVIVSLENPPAGKYAPATVHQHNVRITPEDYEFSATSQKTARSSGSTDTSSSARTGTSSKGASASSPRKHSKRVPSIHL